MARFRLQHGTQCAARDVDAELAFHIDMRIQRLVQGGLDPAAARTQALQQFGDWDRVRGELLAIDTQQEKIVRRANYLAELRQDTVYAVRALRHNLGFALVVVLSLAIGIGANTAIFTLIDALLLRPLPVPDADQLVVIGDPRRTNSVSDGSLRADLFSYPVYAALSRNPQLLRGLAATGRTGRLDLTDAAASGTTGTSPESADAEHPRGRLVSGNYFAVLRVPTLIGRPLTVEDDRAAGGSPVAVISYAYWQRRFEGDRGILGRSLTINHVPTTIVGVTPPGFHGEVVGRMTDIWMPLTMQPALAKRDWLTAPNTSWLLLVGRRAPDATLAQVRRNLLAAIARAHVHDHWAINRLAQRHDGLQLLLAVGDVFDFELEV